MLVCPLDFAFVVSFDDIGKGFAIGCNGTSTNHQANQIKNIFHPIKFVEIMTYMIFRHEVCDGRTEYKNGV